MVNVLIEIEKKSKEEKRKERTACLCLRVGVILERMELVGSREMNPIGKASYLSPALENSSINMALAGLSSFSEAGLALSTGSRTGLQHLLGGRQA